MSYVCPKSINVMHGPRLLNSMVTYGRDTEERSLQLSFLFTGCPSLLVQNSSLSISMPQRNRNQSNRGGSTRRSSECRDAGGRLGQRLRCDSQSLQGCRRCHSFGMSSKVGSLPFLLLWFYLDRPLYPIRLTRRTQRSSATTSIQPSSDSGRPPRTESSDLHWHPRSMRSVWLTLISLSSLTISRKPHSLSFPGFQGFE